jgi:hypothetical protein
MKLIAKTDKEIKLLTPRDIRNFIGSVVDEKYKDEVMWHKHLPPKLIYIKPFKNFFDILTYTNDIGLLYHIADKIKDKEIKIKGINAKIKDIDFKDETFEIPKKRLSFYTTRTPVILSTNPVEFKLVYTLNIKNKTDELKRYIIHRIRTDVEYRAKYYYNLDLNLKDLELIIQNKKIRLVEYKEGLKKFQAVYMNFASNYTLPRFVGYKTGLGWGELISKKIV